MTSRDGNRSEHRNESSRFLEDERDLDLVIAALSHYLSICSDSAAYQDRRFLAWLYHGQRDREGVPVPPGVARAFASRVVGSLKSRRSYGRLIHATPEFHALEEGLSTTERLREAGKPGLAPFLDLAVAAGIGRELWDAECESCVVIPSDLPPAQYVALRVSGDSMQPVLHPGDVILVQIGSHIHTDRMVVARTDDDGYVVKRVHQVRRTELVLESLNPAFGSIRVSRRGNAVLGPVVLRWCTHTDGPENRC